MIICIANRGKLRGKFLLKEEIKNLPIMSVGEDGGEGGSASPAGPRIKKTFNMIIFPSFLVKDTWVLHGARI